jgi:alpha-1,6-mannosyltransferase
VLTTTSWHIAAVSVDVPPAPPGPYVAYYCALAALFASWLALGRQVVRNPSSLGVATVRRYLVAAAVPLLGAAPIGRDLWAYAAQGDLVAHGVDPYVHGPAALPGAFSRQVGHLWVHSPSPYGSLWLQICHGLDWLAGGRPDVAVMLLRLPAFAGLLIGAWALPRIARRFGYRAEPALWLGLASPLVLVLGLGGGHNDLVMIGMMLVGLLVAAGPGLRRLGLGAALLGAAVLVKSPAALALAFTVPTWLRANGHPITARRTATACAVAAGSGLATATALTVACGLGTGWLGQIGPDARWASWLSVPTAAAMLSKVLTGQLDQVGVIDSITRWARLVGEWTLAATAVLAWWRGLRGTPLAYLSVTLAAAALLAPAVQPWYFCWALALAGLVAGPRVLSLLASVPLMFTAMITPSGVGLQNNPAAIAIVLGSVATALLALPRAVRHTPDKRRQLVGRAARPAARSAQWRGSAAQPRKGA